jgi:hypothetical protein
MSYVYLTKVIIEEPLNITGPIKGAAVSPEAL